jgi:gliding motility-associated-like protein
MPAGVTYLWDFGEPGTPDNSSTKRTGTHVYCTPGDKVVSLKLSNKSAPITKTIKVGQLPFIYFGKDENDTTMTICPGQELTLKAFGKVGKPNYPVDLVWFPDGQTTDEIKLKKSGCYSVKVTDPSTGCSVEAKMNVKLCGEKGANSNPTVIYAMGSGAAIEFTTSASNPRVVSGATNVPNGVATLKDIGGLILYTDGVNVFGENNRPILYSNPTQKINTDIANSQGVSIVPKTPCLGCQSEYYIFNLGKNSAGDNVVYYSIVDMKLNGGKGAISTINKLLNPTNVTSKISAIPGPDQQFYWLVSQDAKTGDLMSYKVTKEGITAPIISTGSTSISASSGSSGTMKGSFDFSKLAITSPDAKMSSIDMYTYDPSTGKSSLAYTIPLGKPLPQVYGVEFSTNGNVLYVSMQGDGVNVPSEIWQFDLKSKDITKILATKSVIYSSLDKIGALQMDPVSNTVIYVTFEGGNTLATISQTDRLNSDIDPKNRPIFTRNAITFPAGVTTGKGLPGVVPPKNDSSGPSIEGPNCEGTTFSFKISQKLCDPLNNDRIDWKIYQTHLDPFLNKDGIIVPFDPANTIIYSYTGDVLKYDFATSGKYVVTAAISNSCTQNFLLDAQEFDIDVLKPATIIPEINKVISCNTNPVPLSLLTSPSSPNLIYSWSNGDKTPTANVRYPGGKIDLELTDFMTKCSVKLSSQVNFIQKETYVPTKDYSICKYEPKAFDLILYGPSSDLKFKWEFNSSIVGNSTKVRVSQPGTYTLSITDLENCELKVPIEVKDKCEPTILTPNVFTPNDDKKNDFFIPLPKFPTRAHILGLQIFNRWGELLYSTKGPEFSWDGKVNGSRVPQDSYVWQLQYESLDYPERGVLTDRGGVIVIY